jgi:lysophospholipase L1-like esterase
VSASRRPHPSSRTFLTGGLVAGSLAVLAVPVVQGFGTWRTTRPAVPGPHPQDGLVGGTGAIVGTDPITLVWLGDSLACGVGADTADGALPRKAASLWCEADGHSVDLMCLAQPGACVADVLAAQVPAAVAGLRGPHAEPGLGPGAVAVVTVGANDVGNPRGPRRFRRDYAAVLDALVATGATVIAVGLPHLGSAVVMRRPLRSIASLAGRYSDRVVRRLAADRGAHYVHIAVRAPRGTDPVTYLAADRWHPNDATYLLWAEGVVARLRPLFGVSHPPVPLPS